MAFLCHVTIGMCLEGVAKNIEICSNEKFSPRTFGAGPTNYR
jgi:hypothetical protein